MVKKYVEWINIVKPTSKIVDVNQWKILLLLFLFTACTDDFIPDNPLDPNNPIYESPIVTIISGPENGETLTTGNTTFVWDGNEDAMLFQYKIDDGLLSGWKNSKTVTLDYLDEGDHSFSLQAKYTTGDTTEVQTTRFSVNAFGTNTIRLYPWESKRYNSDSFTVEVIGEEVTNIASAFIEIEFDKTLFTVNSITQGSAFDNCSSPVFIWNDDANETGVIQISCAFLDDGDLCIPVSGAQSLNLANIELKPKTYTSGNTSNLTITANSQYRDVENGNIDIENGAFEGVIRFE